MKIISFILPAIAIFVMVSTFPIVSQGVTGVEMISTEAEIVRKTPARKWGTKRALKQRSLGVRYEHPEDTSKAIPATLRVHALEYKDYQVGDRLTVYYMPGLPNRVFKDMKEPGQSRIAFLLALGILVAWVWFFIRRPKRTG